MTTRWLSGCLSVLVGLAVGCNSSPQTAQEPSKETPPSEQKVIEQKTSPPSAQPAADATETRRKPAKLTPEEARKKLEELGLQNTEAVFMENVKNGKADVVELFLDAGTDPNVKDATTWTALMLATEKGHITVIQALIDAGADLEAKDREGNTALTWAATEGQLEAAKTLIAAGADVNTENVSGTSPLARALLFSRADVAEELKKAGARDPRRQ